MPKTRKLINNRGFSSPNSEGWEAQDQGIVSVSNICFQDTFAFTQRDKHCAIIWQKVKGQKGNKLLSSAFMT